MSENHYDAIIVGSGIGGLATASLLAQIGKQRVLVLEQHWTLGGLTHEFQRKGKFKWDVGVHYVGEMGEGEFIRKIFDFVANKGVHWNKMQDIFEKFVYPDFTFAVSSDPKRYQEQLIDLFKDEGDAIRNYFTDIRRIRSWYVRRYLASFLPFYIRCWLQFANFLKSPKSFLTTKEYCDRHFKDERLKALLISQWGDYGPPPAASAFAMHAVIAHHYLKGGYYPDGGGEAIAKSIQPIIERYGGKCRVNAEVVEIIIKNNTAIGVTVCHKYGNNKETTYFAPVIISDVGAYNTYLRLVKNNQATGFKKELTDDTVDVSAVTLYIGFKESPETLGFRGENHWIYTIYDHDKMYSAAEALLDGKPAFCYLSFPSLKDSNSVHHTGEIICLTPYHFFSNWNAQPWQKREKAYYDLKAKITEGLLDLVNAHYPGFKDLVEYTELSTPLTIEHFTMRSKGMMYGVPATKKRLAMKSIRSQTPIKNLYLAGSDVFSPGIVGAMIGGVAAASLVLGKHRGFWKIMRFANAR